MVKSKGVFTIETVSVDCENERWIRVCIAAPSNAVLLKFFVAADPFYCIQNRCGPLDFVNIFLVIEKLDLFASERENPNRPGKKQISGFGLPPIAVTKIKLKRSVDLQHEHFRLQFGCE